MEDPSTYPKSIDEIDLSELDGAYYSSPEFAMEVEANLKNDNVSPLISIRPDKRPLVTNKSMECQSAFINYHKCLAFGQVGLDTKGCDYFKLEYNVICPEFWLEKWNEWLEKDVLPFNIKPSKQELEKARRSLSKE